MMKFKKGRADDDEKEPDQDQQWLIDYDLEIEGFIEFELPIFLEEINDYELPSGASAVLTMLEFAAQYGLSKESIKRLRHGDKPFRGTWYEGAWMRLEPLAPGLTPFEIAWQLYREANEVEDSSGMYGRARIALRENFVKVGGELQGPLQRFDIEKYEEELAEEIQAI